MRSVYSLNKNTMQNSTSSEDVIVLPTFDNLYPHLRQSYGCLTLCAIFVSIVLLAVMLDLVSHHIQFQTETSAAIAKIVYCAYTPPKPKSLGSIFVTFNYPVHDGKGTVLQGTAHMISNTPTCDLPFGATIRVQYDPNQPSNVDIVDDRLPPPFWQSYDDKPFLVACFLGLILLSFCGGLWGVRRIILGLTKRRHYYLLSRDGKIRRGEIVSCQGHTVDVGKRGKAFEVKMRYRFWNSKLKECYGTQIAWQNSNQSSLILLAEPYTPINVVYVNDHVHCVL